MSNNPGISALTSIQHGTRGSRGFSQCNQVKVEVEVEEEEEGLGKREKGKRRRKRKKKEKHPEWQGRNKIIFIHRQHEHTKI